MRDYFDEEDDRLSPMKFREPEPDICDFCGTKEKAHKVKMRSGGMLCDNPVCNARPPLTPYEKRKYHERKDEHYENRRYRRRS